MTDYIWFDEAIDKLPSREVLERVTKDMDLFGHGVMIVHGMEAAHLPVERMYVVEPLADTRAAQWAKLRAFLDEVRA